MDKIHIRALELEAVIGVYAHEQAKAQPLIFDLCCYVDFSIASTSDCIEDTLDYDHCIQFIKDFCHQNRFALLETLARKLMHKLMKQFALIKRLELKIQKPQARQDAKVSVECQLERKMLSD